VELSIKVCYFNVVSFCAGRIAAISGDCKSPAFGHRRFESDPAHQTKRSDAKAFDLYCFVAAGLNSKDGSGIQDERSECLSLSRGRECLDFYERSEIKSLATRDRGQPGVFLCVGFEHSDARGESNPAHPVFNFSFSML
jgi:hypothetical protein